MPYFGKLPKNMKLWLNSCKTNPTIDWLLYTDDKTVYDYPENVKVTYCSFDEIKNRIQKNFDFKILIDRPWKLCDFRVAYGEVFEEDIKEYDFWGYCDIDVLWGNIRKFITEDILNKYDKIGFQGHSTMYRNNKEVNSRYKNKISKYPSYEIIFTTPQGYCFDENIICDIYKEMNIPYYSETNFAHLRKWEYNFVLAHVPIEEEYKNQNQIFLWDSGNLYRLYLADGKVCKEEFMYIHFFCRPMTFVAKKFEPNVRYLIYPDKVIDYCNDYEIDYKFIKKKSKKRRIKFFVKAIYFNRKKITLRKVIFNIKNMIKHKLRMRKRKMIMNLGDRNEL